MCNIKYDTKDPVIEIGNRIMDIENRLFPRGGMRKGWGRMGVSRCKILYIYRVDKQQGPTV